MLNARFRVDVNLTDEVDASPASTGGTERGNYGQFPCSSKRAILIGRLGETHYTRRHLRDTVETLMTILALSER